MQEDSKIREPPKNKMSAKKKYFTINFLHLIHTVCQSLSTFTRVIVCLHSRHLPHPYIHS
jgi:hypothetical protein